MARPASAKPRSPPASRAIWASPLQIASGAALAAPKDLLPYLTNAEEGSVLFIDEIHRLPKAVEEFMYPAMEDFRVDITLGEGAGARTVNMKLRPFTVIGATTRSGLLSAPLRDRFQIREHLEFYSDRGTNRDRPPQRREAARGHRRRGRRQDRPLQPRHAPNRQQPPPLGPRLLDQHAPAATSRSTIADAALDMLGIDILGLDAQDRKYLETIARVFHGGPAGVEAIAHTMNAALDTLVDEVEPFLLRSELVVRTPRGRKLTAKAYEHLGPRRLPKSRSYRSSNKRHRLLPPTQNGPAISSPPVQNRLPDEEICAMSRCRQESNRKGPA